MNAPSICLIVPMHGDADYFEKCLESFSKLTYSALEIVIVDDGMTESARAKVAKFAPKVQLLKSNGKGPSYARNYAAQQTKAELLAFTDSDCIVTPDWLDQLREGLGSDPEVTGCGGGQTSPADSTPFQKRVLLFLQRMGMIAEYVRMPGDDGIVEVKHNASCNVLYRRKAFIEVGGFPERIWPGEDVVLDRRLTDAGHRLLQRPDAQVYHYRPTTWRSFARWMLRYGMAQGWLVRHYGFFRRVHYVPPVFCVLAAGAIGAAIFWPVLVAVAGLAAVLAAWVWLRCDFVALLLTAVAGQAWMRGYFLGILKPRPID